MIIDLINNESFGYMIEVPDIHFCMQRINTAQGRLPRYYQHALELRKTYYTTHQFLANTLETRPVALSDFAKQDLLKIKHCLRTIIRKHGLLITSTTKNIFTTHHYGRLLLPTCLFHIRLTYHESNNRF